jgi:hypothetical protein
MPEEQNQPAIVEPVIDEAALKKAEEFMKRSHWNVPIGKSVPPRNDWSVSWSERPPSDHVFAAYLPAGRGRQPTLEGAHGFVAAAGRDACEVYSTDTKR